jgi:hypothetical protein
MFNEAMHENGTTHVLIGYTYVGTSPLTGEAFYHSYVEVIGPDHEVYFIRGGPGGEGNGLEALVSDASGSTSLSNGGLGNLTATFGDDARRIDAGRTFMMSSAGFVSQPFSEVQKALEQFGEAVDIAKIPYGPVSTNSNAFAFQAVTVLGLSRPTPPIWVPGHDTVLQVH